MILIPIGLFIAGFFMPLAWWALAGLAIWFLASHKSRRAKAVEQRVTEALASPGGVGYFPDLFFAAARGYAKEKGSTQTTDRDATTKMLISDHLYHVRFGQADRGGTVITVKDWARYEEMLMSPPSEAFTLGT